MKCPDCKNQISTSADVCVHCGNKYFYVETGKTRYIECPECKGTGETYRAPRFTGMCIGCFSKKRIWQNETVNLRTNETVWLKAPRD